MHPLLEIKNLHILFEQEAVITDAVQNISFTAARGKITAIVGESGSGKSITALSVLQLLPKQAKLKGEILFSPDGKEQIPLNDLSSKKINDIRGNHIAMIFQEPMTSLNPVFTCGFQVIETLMKHKKITK